MLLFCLSSFEVARSACPLLLEGRKEVIVTRLLWAGTGEARGLAGGKTLSAISSSRQALTTSTTNGGSYKLTVLFEGDLIVRATTILGLY